MRTAPVSVGIPTFARGLRIVETLNRIGDLDPGPAEVIVHVDQSDGELEAHLRERLPCVRVVSSTNRIGPGGGRHRCLQMALQPYFVSFDDDSWPLDRDFCAEVAELFVQYPHAAVLGATIHHPGEMEPERSVDTSIVSDYTGCGHAMRVQAYRQTTGYIDRPWAYGMEEVDIAMQLHTLDWTILRCGSLRVFHDTQLLHHMRPDVVAGAVQNIALRAFLRYPMRLWPCGLLQVGNLVVDQMRRRRFAGLISGLCGIPGTFWRYASQRRPLPAAKVRSYLNSRP